MSKNDCWALGIWSTLDGREVRLLISISHFEESWLEAAAHSPNRNAFPSHDTLTPTSTRVNWPQWNQLIFPPSGNEKLMSLELQSNAVATREKGTQSKSPSIGLFTKMPSKTSFESCQTTSGSTQNNNCVSCVKTSFNLPINQNIYQNHPHTHGKHNHRNDITMSTSG